MHHARAGSCPATRSDDAQASYGAQWCRAGPLRFMNDRQHIGREPFGFGLYTGVANRLGSARLHEEPPGQRVLAGLGVGTMRPPHMRYISFSYSDEITTRDNNKMVRLITSPGYRQLWGDRFTMKRPLGS
jgi:hypothetical protein